MEERHMDMQDVPRMSPEELYTRMAQGEAVVILDVRTTDGLSVHPDQIPGTRWLPLAEVVQQADTLPRQKTIVTYCT
jgi:rhodanese-related sulfurtransferase